MAEVTKSSKEILTELFDSFDAEPPSSLSDAAGNSSGSSKEEESKEKVCRKKKKVKKSKSHDSKKSTKKKKKKKKHKRKSSHSSSETESSVGRKHKAKHKKSKKRTLSASPDSGDATKSKKKCTGKPVTALDVLSAELSTECTSLLSFDQKNEEVSSTTTDPKTSPLKMESADIPLPKEEDRSTGATNTTDNDRRNGSAVALKVADIFVEDLLESGDKAVVKSLTVPAEKSKIGIKIIDLKKSSVFEAAEAQAKLKAEKYEEGELSDSSKQSSSHSCNNVANKEQVDDVKSSDHEKKKKHKHHKHKKSDKRSPSIEKSTKKSQSQEKKSYSRSRDSSKSRKERHRSKEHRSRRSRSKERDKARSRSKEDKNKEVGDKKRNDKKKDRSKERKKRSRSPHRHSRRRSRSSSRSRRRSRSKSRTELSIDKNKLLEIARKNALSMIKQGTVGSDLNKMAAITAGGKTVDELTDFCKLLSQKDATGQESISSGSCHTSDTEHEQPFHHPFLIKDRPSNIIMNIRNCAALPVKTHQEKTAEHAQQLRLQFPVSSGQQHRKTESEWVPVSPKKTETKATNQTVGVEPAKEETAVVAWSAAESQQTDFVMPPLPADPPPVYQQPPQALDIGDIVTQRLSAMRKLQDNPEDLAANQELKEVQTKMKLWAESKNQPGLFTGSTGARVLSQAELAAGQQAWAKKDQLISAQPVSSGMGMSLLQKMGWKPGEGLGKHNEGTLEPLRLPVKMDKRGLVCAEELPRRQQVQPRRIPPPPKIVATKNLEGKHPVSLLVEYCTKRRCGAPIFTVSSEEGPSHKKSFIFKVTVNGIDYKGTNPSPNKKQAKSEAASVCLRSLGILPNV